MKINTSFFGEIEVNENEIINFPKGILGFEEDTKFILFPLEKESPFFMLQSIENVNVGFIVAYPFSFNKEYSFELNENEKNILKISSEHQTILTFSIVTLKESIKTSTINLLAPIVINFEEKIGKQIVLQDSKQYPLQYPLVTLEGSVYENASFI